MNLQIIEQEVLMNDSLDIYEKMCLIVLMTRSEEEIHITSETLAQLMGCGVKTAKRAFDALRVKGYFSKDYQATPPVQTDKSVIKHDVAYDDITQIVDEEMEHFQEGFYRLSDEVLTVNQNDSKPLLSEEEDYRRRFAEYVLGPSKAQPSRVKTFVSQKETKESLVDEVIALIDEKISFKEANILLAFANNDIEKIKKHYKQAKGSQVSDTMGVLIASLQKQDEPQKRASDHTQINTQRLMKMQAYQNFGTKK